jgi:predicted RNA-binding Zn-ribbon protein involved in translation (DUF1610 family)
MDNRPSCPICKTPNVNRSTSGSNTLEFTCPRCGRFQIQTLAETQLRNARPAFPPMHILSGLCRNTWDLLGEKLLITVDLFKSWDELDKAAQIPIPRDTDPALKGEYLMRFIKRKTRAFADPFTFSQNELATGFCANRHELDFCLRFLAEKGFIEEPHAPQQAKGRPPQGQEGITCFLTPAGWAALENAKVPSSAAPATHAALTAAVAATVDPAFWAKGFSAGLQAAGFNAVRVDARAQTGKISDDIIVELRRADILIADLTDHSPLTLFEAGLALGYGKPVFWTGEEAAVRDKGFPLDLRQRTVTTWTKEDPATFAARLSLRVEAEICRR